MGPCPPTTHPPSASKQQDEGLCYPLGWSVLRVITVGKYPEKDLKSGIREEQEWNAIDYIASFIGFFLLFVTGLYCYVII